MQKNSKHNAIMVLPVKFKIRSKVHHEARLKISRRNI